MKKKKDGKSRMPRWKKALITAGVIAAVAAVAVFVLFYSPLFKIRAIEVPEFEHYSESDVRQYLEKYIGKNGLRTVIGNSSASQSKSFFSMELVKSEEEIMFACPYLENVTVKFRMNGTLTVEAEERRDAFLTEYCDTYIMCDSHGVVLETYSEENVPDDVPLVKGIALSGYKLGRSISDGRDKNTDVAIKICGLMAQLEMEGYIDIIDVSDYNNIYMFCAPSLTIRFGGPEDSGVKLSLLKSVMDEGVDGDSNATVTVADGKQVTFVKNGERED